MKDRGYIISANGAEKVTCMKEAEAIGIVLSLRKEGHTAEMRRDGTKEFIPVSQCGHHASVVA